MTIAHHRPAPNRLDIPAPRRPPAAETVEPRDAVVPVPVWQTSIRLLHWLLVATIVVLTITGFYIGTPVLAPQPGSIPMQLARAVHLFTGFLFTAVLLARFVLLFTGNRWARWRQFLPVEPERRRLLVPSLRYYLFIDKEPPPVVGHNPLAGLTYLVLFAMFVAQAVTGIALEAVEERGGWAWTLTGWVFDIASVPTVRFFHHLVMWLTIGFVVHHVYSAVLVDREERSGEISSIISGWKSVPRSRVEDDVRHGR
ncbi:MAG TPA: Ni/Fe-hydrogenase, b-type cytochrome subunit [Mycobacteriales bacterium]|nr:Ni/Fe-hydrogenase, b-type cytochrome subunit [Mycobacteriales bacterium]